MKVGASVKVTVATGRDPAAAIARITSRWAEDGRPVLQVAVQHDEGCPCLDGGTMPSCTCELVGIEGTRVA